MDYENKNEELDINIEDNLDNGLPLNYDRLFELNVNDEMKSAFIEYSMSVIISRAIPDLRDGLKPVHRRILWGMYAAGTTYEKKQLKSATTVGNIIGHYHPHGDSSVYDALVRLAQSHSLRHPLIWGHGGFGTAYLNRASASRYTEAKLEKISNEMLRDINKDTVDFQNAFGDNDVEPIVLPSRFPNILVNGTSGIAVGMATNIPPHNLSEVIDGCIAYLDNSEITLLELMEIIKGPDFPTGGIIMGINGIKNAYLSGKGSITLRARCEIVDIKNKTYISITELPYMVEGESVYNSIVDLVNDKTIDGIVNVYDKSDDNPNLKDKSKPFVKLLVELKKDANPEIVLNNLYKHTQIQTGYGINLLMLDQGVPKSLGLYDIISKYIDFQKQVIIRKCRFELNKYQERLHILEGFKIALDNIDEIIRIIKESDTDAEIKSIFLEKYGLDDVQSEAILEMKLRRLSNLERGKVEDEYNNLLRLIDELNNILSSDKNIREEIKKDLIEIKKKYADERRTEIDLTSDIDITDESLIPVDNIVITLTNKGYVKRVPSDTYKTQNRGGVGIKGMSTNEEDFVEKLISLTTHDYLMFFTSKGKIYRVKGYSIPEYSRQAKGLPIVNLLNLEKEEIVTAMLKIEQEDACRYLVFATKKGYIKRTDISEFENVRTNGKIAITLRDDDELISVKKTSGSNEILMASSNGRMVRFVETAIRSMGRTASGVRGINLGDGVLVGMEIANENQMVLVITEKGYGKKTPVDDYRITNRGGKGVKTLNVAEKNGSIVSFKVVDDTEELIIITDNGIVIRLEVKKISTMSRVTQGVRLIQIKDDQKVASTSLVEAQAEFEENSDELVDKTEETDI